MGADAAGTGGGANPRAEHDEPLWAIGQYNPDGSPDVPPFLARGLAAILDVMGKAAADNTFFWRACTRSVIALGPPDADGVVRRATARTPSIERAQRRDGTGYDNLAFYDDVLVRAGDAPTLAQAASMAEPPDRGWRFRERRYDYVWVDNRTPIPGSAIPLPPELLAADPRPVLPDGLGDGP